MNFRRLVISLSFAAMIVLGVAAQSQFHRSEKIWKSPTGYWTQAHTNLKFRTISLSPASDKNTRTALSARAAP